MRKWNDVVVLDVSDFWRAVLERLALPLRFQRAVVWHDSSTLLFDMDAERVVHAEKNTPRSANLHVGALFNALRLDFQLQVRSIQGAALGKFPHIVGCMGKDPRTLRVTAMNFKSNRWLRATVALYIDEDSRIDVPDVEKFLRLSYGAIQRDLSRLIEANSRGAIALGLMGFLQDVPIGLVLLDWSLRILFANGQARRDSMLWEKIGEAVPRDSAAVIPQAIWRELQGYHAQISASLRENEPFPPFSTNVKDSANPNLNAVISVVFDPSAGLLGPNFIVRYSARSTLTPDRVFEPTLDQISILAELTVAEQAVAQLVLRGLSNDQVASQLNRQLSTVKDHLSRIYTKLGVRSRSQLVSLMSTSRRDA